MTENLKIPPNLSLPNLLDVRMYTKGDYKPSVFETFKLLAIWKIGQDVIRVLRALKDTCKKIVCLFKAEEIPHNMFGWSWDHCIERRKHSIIWLNVLIRKLPANCANMQKTMVDLKELIKYIIMILEPYIQETAEYDALLVLRKDLNVLHITSILQQELKENAKVLSDGVQRLNALRFVSKGLMILRRIVLNTSLDGGILINLTYRYATGFQQAVEDQEVLRCEMAEQALAEQLADYVRKTENEAFASQSSLNMTYIEIQQLRYRLSDMMDLFDKEYYAVVGKSDYLQNQLYKMKTQRVYLKEQIRRYKEEIQRYRTEKASLLESKLINQSVVSSMKSFKSMKSYKSLKLWFLKAPTDRATRKVNLLPEQTQTVGVLPVSQAKQVLETHREKPTFKQVQEMKQGKKSKD